jgi:hypothetical protein
MTFSADDSSESRLPADPLEKQYGYNPLMTRDEQGRFVKGYSGNPRGRPKGAKERATLVREYIEEALMNDLASDARDILVKAVALAKDGEKDMIRLLLGDMIRPARMPDADPSAGGKNGKFELSIQISNNTKEEGRIITVTQAPEGDADETDD